MLGGKRSRRHGLAGDAAGNEGKVGQEPRGPERRIRWTRTWSQEDQGEEPGGQVRQQVPGELEDQDG